MGRNKQRGQKAGPLLDEPRILLPEPGFLSQYLFYTALLLLGGLGALASFFTAFEVPLSGDLLLGLGIGTALLCGLLSLWKKRSWALPLSAAALWAAAVAVFFDDLLLGCARTLNLVLQAYQAKLNTPLFHFAVDPAGPKEAAYQCTVFAALLLFPFFWLLSWLFVHRKSALGTFCLTGLFLLAPMAISLLPETWALACLLLFWTFLLLTAPTLGQRHKLLDERGRFHASGVAAARPATLLLLPVAALCMALVYAVFPMETYERPQFANDIRSGLADGFGLSALFQGGVGNGNGSVNLNSLGERRYTGKTVLRVKYDWDARSSDSMASNREKDYLKSYVGSVYTGGSWERLPPEDAQELHGLLGDVRPQELPSQFQQLVPMAAIDSQVSYRLSVENAGGNPRCIYTPYGLAGLDSFFPQESALPVDDGFLKAANWLTGVKEYDLTAVSLTTSQQPYFYRLYWYYLDQAFNQYNYDFYKPLLNETEMDAPYSGFDIEEKRTELDERLTQDITGQFGMFERFDRFTADLWKAPDWFLDPFSPEAQAFARSMEAYNDFVYEHYTQLPEGLAEFLTQYLRENGIQELDETLLYGQDYFLGSITDLFRSQFTYTLSPPVAPSGTDFVEYFLSESRQGYCVHFATAAVALLRSAGIPARYAEGYAVPSGKNGTWVNVPDYNAHAWVEVYVGGTGWFPLEVTPGSPEAPAVYYNATAPEATATPKPTASPDESSAPVPSSSSPLSSGPSPTPSRTESSSPTGSSGASQGLSEDTAAILSWCLGAAAALLLLLLALWENRRLHLRVRKKEFAQPDKNRAILRAYAHLEKLCALGRSLPPPTLSIPQELEDLAMEAKFSTHTLSSQELLPFLREITAAECRLTAELSLLARLRCQYLLGLF